MSFRLWELESCAAEATAPQGKRAAQGENQTGDEDRLWPQSIALHKGEHPSETTRSAASSMKPALLREVSASATQFPPTSQFQHLSEALKIIKIHRSLDFPFNTL